MTTKETVIALLAIATAFAVVWITIGPPKPESATFLGAEADVIMSDAGTIYVLFFNITSRDGRNWSLGIKLDGSVDVEGDLPEGYEMDLWDALAASWPGWFERYCEGVDKGSMQ